MSAEEFTPQLEEIIKPDDVVRAEQDPDNAGNPVAVKTKTKRVAEKVKSRRAVVGALLETKEGREFLGYLVFELGGLYKPLASAAFDENSMHFREGARHVALALHIECLHADATRYSQMRSEFEGLA